jgi:prolyl oligopeptidase family protein
MLGNSGADAGFPMKAGKLMVGDVYDACLLITRLVVRIRPSPDLTNGRAATSVARPVLFIGALNGADQAAAAQAIAKWPFVDAQRLAVWKWSGGGATTLDVMFRTPDVYNRTHRIRDGHGTTLHLYSLLTRYMREHLPGGEPARMTQ